MECEGIHLLCVKYGRFDHYKEGCNDKKEIENKAMGIRKLELCMLEKVATIEWKLVLKAHGR